MLCKSTIERLAIHCGFLVTKHKNGCFIQPPLQTAVINEQLSDFANAVALKAIAEYKASLVPVAWISVDDRLPKNGDSILCFRQDDGWIIVCDYIKRVFIFGDMQKAHLISHWQPLPALPTTTD